MNKKRPFINLALKSSDITLRINNSNQIILFKEFPSINKWACKQF